jgi:hypothetical protein
LDSKCGSGTGGRWIRSARRPITSPGLGRMESGKNTHVGEIVERARMRVRPMCLHRCRDVAPPEHCGARSSETRTPGARSLDAAGDREVSTGAGATGRRADPGKTKPPRVVLAGVDERPFGHRGRDRRDVAPTKDPNREGVGKILQLQTICLGGQFAVPPIFSVGYGRTASVQSPLPKRTR